ncbi:hypothetical protein CCYS_05390 [Corynebacterium cystitidis DSM 20524]|nr:hypothetical protein CCYS_05390 [Corynebacterium cystitidis DSM 20524]SNV80702.1 Uncharacterised protein [Corynebacterium cystitidis]
MEFDVCGLTMKAVDAGVSVWSVENREEVYGSLRVG